MRVFVTGATGALGPHAVFALLAGGHDVTALARTPEKARLITAHGATPVTALLFDVDALAEAFAGHDAVANLATAIPAPSHFLRAAAWHENDRIRDAGSAAVVAAMQLAEVPRLVQESIVFNLADGGSAWLDEESPLDPLSHGRTALIAEERVAEAADIDAVTLRFGLFYGPGSEHSELLIGQARRHIGFVAGPADAFQPAIHLADAATAVVAALEAPGGLYSAVDDESLTRREVAAAVGDAVGVKPWVRAPGGLAGLAGPRAQSLVRSQRVSNRTLRASTAWRPAYPSAREGWAATVERMQHA